MLEKETTYFDVCRLHELFQKNFTFEYEIPNTTKGTSISAADMMYLSFP